MALAPERPETVPYRPAAVYAWLLAWLSAVVEVVTTATATVATAAVDALADALAARGHDRGAVYHLPELDDDSSDDGGRDEPTRSEPADFGHGESTGVQEL